MEKYRIELNGILIGYTALEGADPPMGCVSGVIEFIPDISCYKLFKEYCLENGVILNLDDEVERFIDTQVIPELKVFSENNVEIVSDVGTTITGGDNLGFEINILGIAYPFYEEQFPHHVKAYNSI